MSIKLDTSLKTPNEEQAKAINHSGGVLLSAGAGSGKTFVLVEHIVHLFEEFSKQHKDLSPEDFSHQLRDYFSQIVMMTFTKKAAGELSLRLKDRFELAVDRAKSLEAESVSVRFWEIANEQLDNLFVGTIHSFCYRLISQGLVPGFSGSEDMISEPELKNKLNDLFDTWLEDNIGYLKENEFEHVLINKVFYRNHLLKIFSDTDLRVLWSEYQGSEESTLVEEFESLLPLFCNQEWRSFLFNAETYRPDDKKVPVWFKFLENFSEKTSGCTSFLDFSRAANEVFLSLARMPSAPRKEGLDGVRELMAKIKSLRDFLKSYYPDMDAALSNSEKFENNGELILKIYRFLEEKYFSVPGLTFTDLEFFVWKALINSSTACEEIQKNYNYFIIDEFQDTSNVQFSIVRAVIKEDMNKVFCVGDIKQAIYGFRGGELGVFKETEESIYQPLSLKNNYRSSEKVIRFNNQLFDHVLPLGDSFKGIDDYSVPMLKQVVPDFRMGTGAIEKKTVRVTGEFLDGSKSLKPTALNLIEGREIAEKVAMEPSRNFCILYRKLTPTRFLIPALTKLNVGFTCQIKIQLDQDPILALFCEYTRMLSFCESEAEFSLSFLVIDNILAFLNIPLKSDDIQKRMREAVKESKTFGLLESFKRFIWAIGLSSTNLDHSWPLVEILCHLSTNSPEKAFEKVGSYNDENYSIDFRFGENSSRVVIMTAHSSKGLEFDHVILGGIHTNGVDKNDGDFLGKYPKSYKWFLGRRKSEVFRSPAYIKEQEIRKRKSFAESKRLFYVAATRAAETLCWIDISFNEKPASFSQNSWVNALRSWEATVEEENIDVHKWVSDSVCVVERTLEHYELEDSRLDLSNPIFQEHSLGVEWSSTKVPSLGNSAELSVTRLASLVQCPRKFHLKNVLKLDGEDLVDENLMDKTIENLSKDESGEVSFDAVGGSSASRGTEVHEVLEVLVKRNFILPRIVDLDSRALEGINWVSGLFKEKYFSGEYDFISEEPLKFAIFGQMISGTPDLIIQPRVRKGSSSIEIWDYKTGRYNEKKSLPYWFQLYCYGLSQSGEESQSVKLVLAFIDEQKEYSQTLTVSELKSRIFTVWDKLSKPDEINREHCASCEFGGLCFPST